MGKSSYGKHIWSKSLKNGLMIHKYENEVGGYTYTGEGYGIEAMLWDTCIGSEEELKIIYNDIIKE